MRTKRYGESEAGKILNLLVLKADAADWRTLGLASSYSLSFFLSYLFFHFFFKRSRIFSQQDSAQTPQKLLLESKTSSANCRKECAVLSDTLAIYRLENYRTSLDTIPSSRLQLFISRLTTVAFSF